MCLIHFFTNKLVRTTVNTRMRLSIPSKAHQEGYWHQLSTHKVPPGNVQNCRHYCKGRQRHYERHAFQHSERRRLCPNSLDECFTMWVALERVPPERIVYRRTETAAPTKRGQLLAVKKCCIATGVFMTRTFPR